MGNFKLKEDIKNISKIKVTNFQVIKDEEIVTNMLLLGCLEYIEKYNLGFLPFKNNLVGLQNMITCCINILDDYNTNLIQILDILVKIKEPNNTFSNYYEELLEILEEDNINWHLIFSKTFIKIKLYNDIKQKNKL